MKINRNLLWNYIGYATSLGVNLFLLPMVLFFLSSEELGLWYVFLSIGTFINLVDFGFSPQLARFITYAYAGADEIQKEGVIECTGKGMNAALLKKLLSASRKLYFLLSLLTLLLLLSVGTFYVCTISETLNTTTVLTAWWTFCIASFINILYCYYNAFFRGIGDFVDLNKAILYSKGVQIIFSFIGLYLGYGLFAVAFAFLLSGIVSRFFLRIKLNVFKRKNFLNIVKEHTTVSDIFKIIWHNSWREGIVTLSRFLVIQVNTILCSLYINLSETASYALAVQILTIISSVSFIYFTTKLPDMNAARVTNDTEKINRLLSMSWFSYIVSYSGMLFLLFTIGFSIIEYIKPNLILDNTLFFFVAVYMFLESNHSLFASYISTSNKLPYVFPYLISAVGGVLFSLFLLKYTNLGIWGIVAGPFIVQLFYNNWKWPYCVMKALHTTPLKLFVEGAKTYVNMNIWKIRNA